MLSPSAARRVGRVLASSVLALMTVLVMLVSLQTSSATADECVPSTLPDGVVIPCGGGAGEGGDGGEGGGGGPAGGEPRTCRYLAEEISCSSSYGSWIGRCYVRTADPQPPAGDPAWEGNTDGAVLECTPYPCAQSGGDLADCAGHSFYWSPEPVAPVGPSPEELARRAVATMQLRMGEIGSTPPSSANATGAVGTIGLPIWLWIADRTPNAIGPITRSASDAGLTVSAVGNLDRVEWTLTDATGAVHGAVTCSGAHAPGTPYDGRDSAAPSPTCGFGADLNRVPGDLTLTGTAYWVVEWQGGNQTGQIDVPAQSNSVPLRIGELQALVER